MSYNFVYRLPNRPSPSPNQHKCPYRWTSHFMWTRLQSAVGATANHPSPHRLPRHPGRCSSPRLNEWRESRSWVEKAAKHLALITQQCLEDEANLRYKNSLQDSWLDAFYLSVQPHSLCLDRIRLDGCAGIIIFLFLS